MPNGVEPIVAIQVRASVASFRRPPGHNYQRTLPMPPPTTLLGITGAALGFSEPETSFGSTGGAHDGPQGF
jgi:CRISPR-associated Cas5-like protein